MKKKIFLMTFFALLSPPFIALAAESVKLPFAAGERFIVANGYNSPPTHIKKDSYAIDFTQNSCEAYGKLAIAAFSGTALIVEENGYNGGYGTQILIIKSGNVVARYAHMIPGSIPVRQGDAVSQGTVIGEIGDTGLVAGAACAEHPGTHIHFAIYTENKDGSFTAKDPEPISGYTGIVEEKWYTSDNVLAATTDNLATLIAIVKNLFGGAAIVVNPASSPMVATTTAAMAQTSISTSSKQVSSVISVTSRGVTLSVPATSSPPSSSANSSQSDSVPAQTTVSSGLVSSVAQAPAISGSSVGGGSGPSVGGVGAAATVPATLSPPQSTTSIPSSTDQPVDDPSDDVVQACQ